MHYPFGLACRTRSIEDKQHILRIHLLCRAFEAALCFHLFYFVLPPYIAALDHANRGAAVRKHNYLFNRRALHQSIINNTFERNLLVAPVTAIGGNHDAALRVLYAVGNGLRRKSPEHYRMHSADAGAGQYRYSQLGHHGHVQANTVAFSGAVVFKHMSKLAYLIVQLLVGEHPVVFGRVIGFPDDGRLIARLFQVPVEAVFGNIKFSAFKPFNIRLGKTPAQYMIPLFTPGIFFGNAAPECLGLLNALLINVLIFFERGNFHNRSGYRLYGG